MRFYSDSEKRTANLDDNAMKVLKKRFLRGETPDEMFWRVASHIAENEKQAVQFYNLLASTDFMPNSPTLMNAGRPLGQLAACFVVPVGDSMEEIFQGIKDMAMIQKTGGGTGFSFSRLRPAGDPVTSTNGESSGPISFMKAYNACTEVIKQGGARRGANMGVLRVDHPDILEFIDCKNDTSELTNFNISVAITDEFMSCLRNKEKFALRYGGVEYAKVDPQLIWDKLTKSAWSTGEPGIIFIDAINKDNPTPRLGEVESTNPCGEQPLMPFEACNLGSINLANMFKHQPSRAANAVDMIDWEHLKEAIHLSTVFLDNIIDVNNYPLPEIAETTRSNRKIGLGVMGWADLLFSLQLPYDSAEATGLAGAIMEFIQQESTRVSHALALEKGNFPNWEHSVWGDHKMPMRNAVTTTIAPTGTISIIAGTSSGIEPLFGLYFEKTLVDSGKVLPIINGQLWDYMIDNNFSEGQIDYVVDYIKQHGTLQGSEAPRDMQDIFKVSSDISPLDHIRMQAAFQEFTDNAVSKTINFDNDVSVGDISDAMLLAYDLGCKGLTVYRDGSRNSQPLTKGVKKEETEVKWGDKIAEEAPLCIECALPDEVALPSNGVVMKKRPMELSGKTKQVQTGCGTLFVTINECDGEVYETFLKAGTTGGCAAFTEGTARLISVAIRYGVPVGVIIDQLRSVRCDNFRHQVGKNPNLKGKSCPDVVGRVLKEYQDLLEKDKAIHAEASKYVEKYFKGVDIDTIDTSDVAAIVDEASKCPECGEPITFAEGCVTCFNCGFTHC